MTSNVLLIVLDSVRAQNAGIHGYQTETTPFLQELAQQASVYHQARTSAIFSVPGHASIFTGLNVEEHGVRSPSDALRAGSTVWEELDERGYSTGLFTYNGLLLQADYGLSRGFDTIPRFPLSLFPGAGHPQEADLDFGQAGTGRYVDYLRYCLDHRYPLRSILNGIDIKLRKGTHGKRQATADVYADRFLDWIGETREPWAACVNFMDAHLPYEVTAGHYIREADDADELQRELEDQVFEFYGGHRPWSRRKTLERLYDCTIHQMDAAIETIVHHLQRTAQFENTMLVVTSDHGEGFGERSRLEPGLRIAAHKLGIHEVLLHVPLLVKYPGQSEPREFSKLASITGFPEAVRNARDGTWTGNEFLREKVIASSRSPRGESEIEQARKYCDDIAFMHGYRRAVYEDQGDRIVKYMTSESSMRGESHATTVEIKDGRISRIEADARGVVEETYDSVRDAGVREERTDPRSIGPGTERRLRELGYL